MTRVLRVAEKVAWALGITLLVGSLGAWFGGRLVGRGDVARFEAARQQRTAAEAGAGLPSELPADTRLWSDGRLRAYQESLGADPGLPLAVLRIPRLQIAVPVFEGTDELVLNRGVGRIEGTAAPGESGNLGLAGHRDGFFRALKDIVVADEVVLELLDGRRDYRVAWTRVVEPSDVSVLEPDGTDAVTLVTCYPFYFVGSAPQRFIVRAVAAH